MDNRKHLNQILNIALIIFLGISTYTTKIGLSLLWKEENNLTNEIISWILAIGTSLLLYYISSFVATSFKKRQFIKLTLGYFLIGSLSAFFNFNTFYSRQSKQIRLNEEVTNIRNAINLLLKQGKQDLRKDIIISQNLVDSLKAEMDSEKINPSRVGESPIFHKIRLQYTKSKNKLQTLKQRYKVTELSIDSLAKPTLDTINQALSETKESSLRQAIIIGINTHTQIRATIVSKLPTPSNNKAYTKLSENKDFEEANYSFKMLIKYIGKDHDTLSDDQKKTILLSIFFSVMLDFPIFFLLIILNIPAKSADKSYNPFEQKETNKNEASIWGENANIRLTDNNTETKNRTEGDDIWQ